MAHSDLVTSPHPSRRVRLPRRSLRLAFLLGCVLAVAGASCSERPAPVDDEPGAEERAVADDAAAAAPFYCASVRRVAVDARQEIDEAFARRDRHQAVAESVRSLGEATRAVGRSLRSVDLDSRGAADFATILERTMTARAAAYDDVASQVAAMDPQEPRFAPRVDALVSTVAVTANEGADSVRLPSDAARFWTALGDELAELDGCADFAETL